MTDKRLSSERRKTDETLEERQRQLAERTDAILTANRNRSDAAVADWRAQEDSRRQDASAPADRGQLDRDRRDRDVELAQQREDEDRTLRDERAARRRLFAALLAEHRARTDEALRIERSRVDEAIDSHDVFLGIVSHDVRGMAAAISLSSEVISKSLRAAPQSDEVKHGIERIQRAADQIHALVSDLLDVSAIATSKFVVNPSPRDMAAVVRDALDMIQPLAAEKGLQVRGQGIEGRLLARMDERRILQVLANLLGNAVKFSHPGSEVRVQLERSGDDVECSVTDFGIGIEGDSLDKIFDRYQRGAHREGAGAGLGLYIARAIVEAHGGRIWVESRVGLGSTFHFTLPAVD